MDYEITVILPVYNGAEFLSKSIESVLIQSYKDFEFIVCDDDSTDASQSIVRSYSDERIKFISNTQNLGLFPTLNRMISIAKGKLIKLWAQDDVMYPHCLQSFVDFHWHHPGIGFSYSGRDIIDENNKVITPGGIDNTPPLISPELHARIAFYTGSIAGNIANVCLVRSALDEVGPFNTGMKISADFDMWVRLAKDHKTGFIPDKLIQLRDHKGQLSRNEGYYLDHVREDLIVYRNLLSYVNSKQKKEGTMLLRKYKFVYYYTLMVKAILKGKFKKGYLFFKELSVMDNFLALTVSFVHAKLGKIPRPDLLN